MSDPLGASATVRAVRTVRTVRTVDYHTGGEPFRIVPEPPVGLPGATVAERRARAQVPGSGADTLRRVLCHEPRGHADMYGGLIVPPDDERADLGVLFFHKDGFSTACGHGTIALGRWAVDTGLVAAPDDGVADVRIDVPSGRVTARVLREGGRTTGVVFVSVPSWAVAAGVPVATSVGEVRVYIGFGGAFYAHLDVTTVGMHVVPQQLDRLRALGREIKWALDDAAQAVHPHDPRLNGMYGTVLFEDLGTAAEGARHQRNVVVFADGEVDRSPCGSGTASRVAVLDAAGAMPGGVLVHDSIVGSRFTATVHARTNVDGRDAVVPAVLGTAHPTGRHEFLVEPDDDLRDGFLLA